MTEKSTELTVGRVAEQAGVSVRTLHHWDSIGLVVPGGRSWSGYRLYDSADIARLHRVLVYRELGLPLAQIREILDDPRVDMREHLTRQRDLLAERIRRLTRTAQAVDEMIERTSTMTTNNVTLSPEEQMRIFGKDWDPAWQDEAEQRWGRTEAWAQSMRSTADFTSEDWERLAREVEQLNQDLGAAKLRGVEPGSEEANALAERHRASIAQHYDCGYARHVVLSGLYVQDERFTATYEKHAPGLAAWLRDVIVENARAHGVDPETATWD